MTRQEVVDSPHFKNVRNANSLMLIQSHPFLETFFLEEWIEKKVLYFWRRCRGKVRPYQPDIILPEKMLVVETRPSVSFKSD
jgi:hypothetical protein